MEKISTIINSFIDKIQNHTDNGLMGLPSGFRDLDRITGGFEGSDLIVIGARPLMGKTIFIMQLILRMTRDYNIPSLFFSLDLSATQFISRMISSVAEIENTKLITYKLSDDEWKKFEEASKILSNFPLYITDKPTTIENLCDVARIAVKENGVQVIFVDYLQSLSPSERRENRYQDIAYCTRTLKALAKELNVPVIVTSQLNRNVEYRQWQSSISNRPEMYDLRDSGTICEDSNLIILLDRPELREGPESSEGNDLRGLLEVIIAKNNNGREGEIKLRFKGNVNKIDDWEEEYRELRSNISDIGIDDPKGMDSCNIVPF